MFTKNVLSMLAVVVVGTLGVACAAPTSTTEPASTTEETGTSQSALKPVGGCDTCDPPSGSSSGGGGGNFAPPTQTQSFTCDGSGGYQYTTAGAQTACGVRNAYGIRATITTFDASGAALTAFDPASSYGGFSTSWTICPYWSPYLRCNAYGSCYCSAY
jgi:hypothetical protein